MFSGRKGFTLIELLLVISTGIAISFMSFQKMLQDHEANQSKMAGQQIKQIANAANMYIVNHFDKLSSLSNSDNTSMDIGPRSCSSTNQTCSITIQTLINESYLPASHSGKNVFGAGYTITLKRSGNAPYYNISGLVLTDQSLSTVSDSTKIRYDLLGRAMQEAGIDSGMTRLSPTIIEGFKGMWNSTSNEFSAINRQGLLGHILGYGSNSFSTFLRRDGSLPMTGSLNMGNNDINNVKDINATGSGNFSGQLSAKNGYGDTITLGGDANSNDYELKLGSAKPLTLYSPAVAAADRANTTLLNVQGQVSVSGNQLVGKTLATNGLSSSDMPAGSPGGIRTYDVISGGSVMTLKSGTSGTDSQIAAYINKDGYIYGSGNVTAGRDLNAGNWVWGRNMAGDAIGLGGDDSGDYEIKLMSKDKYLTLWWPEYFNQPEVYRDKMVLQTWGGIYADGFIKTSNNIQASGNITANGTISGQYIQPTSTVTLGLSCSNNGSLSKLSDGTSVACINNTWNNGFKQGKQRNGGMVMPNNMKMMWGMVYVPFSALKDLQVKEGNYTLIPSFVDDNGNTITMNTVLSAQVSPYDVVDLLGGTGLEGARLNSISGNTVKFAVSAKDLTSLGMYAEWLAIGY